jgi:hypothetical protein
MSFRSRMLAALGATFVPPRFAGDWHGGDPTSVAMMHEFMGRAPWWVRLAFVLPLFVIQLAPLLLIGKPRTFLGLTDADRLRYLNKFCRQPPFAVIFAPLRALLGICIYARPDAIAEIGYSNAGRPA